MADKPRNKNFMREMQIKAKKIKEAMINHPQATLETFKNLSVETRDKVANKVAGEMIKKAGISERDTQANLKKFCIFYEGLIKAAAVDPSGNALGKLRVHMLSQLPKAIHDYLTGDLLLGDATEKATKQQIIDFYWGVPEFPKVWERLSLTKDNFEVMIDTEIKALDGA